MCCWDHGDDNMFVHEGLPGLKIGKKIGLPLCLVFDRWSKFSPAI